MVITYLDISEGQRSDISVGGPRGNCTEMRYVAGREERGQVWRGIITVNGILFSTSVCVRSTIYSGTSDKGHSE